MKLGEFRNDLNLENDGVWISLNDAAKVKVARSGNPRHSEILRRLSAPYRRQISNNSLSNDVAFKISGEALAEAILLDWEGVEDDDGKPLPYSKSAARDLLCNRQYEARFRNPIVAASEEVEAFRQTVIGDAEKNSQTGLPGV